MRRNTYILFVLLVIILVLLSCVGVVVGSVAIPFCDLINAIIGKSDATTRFIIVDNRVTAIITAILACASLSVAGLMMQTCFNNPLAGPTIMGISSGASLGMAIVILATGSLIGFWGRFALISGAFLGAAIVLVILLFISSFIVSADILLIAGILIGYLASSAITILNYFATDSAVHGFVIWGMGSFATVGLDGLPFFAIFTLILLILCYPCSKTLNALLFGSRYAASSGVNMRKALIVILTLSGLMTAIVTACCGPIAFIGLVAPHIARIICRSSNHFILIPLTALVGANMGVFCQVLSVAPSVFTGQILPVNAITPLIGVPVIVYILLNRRRLVYFV